MLAEIAVQGSGHRVHRFCVVKNAWAICMDTFRSARNGSGGARGVSDWVKTSDSKHSRRTFSPDVFNILELYVIFRQIETKFEKITDGKFGQSSILRHVRRIKTPLLSPQEANAVRRATSKTPSGCLLKRSNFDHCLASLSLSKT